MVNVSLFLYYERAGMKIDRRGAGVKMRTQTMLPSTKDFVGKGYIEHCNEVCPSITATLTTIPFLSFYHKSTKQSFHILPLPSRSLYHKQSINDELEGGRRERETWGRESLSGLSLEDRGLFQLKPVLCHISYVTPSYWRV
ncbi:hypothetical protein I3843_09G000500 [Carya illinoinensis]|uniref:Uncharacterized protein n=1 Tax=Carya illinoinensis TaxID=32201 RepID=A0A8T1PEB3_CARIL|nr:hypothetical protein I3760_09G000400 [Carya illinoinensis]KAG6640388.1 hypothetical protein CIPAW_09G000600 [Carya illinoinensis]KAG6693413.1 hypothetical protein I3842_09G000500 [Carya illinoinensis]KAG7961115.1 hypothetical protein I3843_09G000500 [Carya illinoinensis]